MFMAKTNTYKYPNAIEKNVIKVYYVNQYWALNHLKPFYDRL